MLRHMPELAEVDYYRRRWDAACGASVTRVLAHEWTRVYRLFGELRPEVFSGKRLEASFAHGKQMLFRFSGGHFLGVHLGMTGELFRVEGDYAPAVHDHLVLFYAEGALVFRDPRQFGSLKASVASTPLPDWWQALPPALLSSGFTRSRVQEALQRFSRSPVKAVLLKQEYFPGLGNWMADEVLYQAGIHPECPAGAVTRQRLTRLYEVIRYISAAAMRIISRDWGTPPEDWLFQYRWRAGGHCPRSGCALERITVGGRTSCFSPKVQTFYG